MKNIFLGTTEVGEKQFMEKMKRKERRIRKKHGQLRSRIPLGVEHASRLNQKLCVNNGQLRFLTPSLVAHASRLVELQWIELTKNIVCMQCMHCYVFITCPNLPLTPDCIYPPCQSSKSPSPSSAVIFGMHSLHNSRQQGTRKKKYIVRIIERLNSLNNCLCDLGLVSFSNLNWCMLDSVFPQLDASW